MANVDLHNKFVPGQKLYISVEVNEVYIDDTGITYGLLIEGLNTNGMDAYLDNIPETALLEGGDKA